MPFLALERMKKKLGTKMNHHDSHMPHPMTDVLPTLLPKIPSRQTITSHPEAWRPLRTTSKGVKDLVDGQLYRHVLFRVATKDEINDFYKLSFDATSSGPDGTRIDRTLTYQNSPALVTDTHYIVTDRFGRRLPAFPPRRYASPTLNTDQRWQSHSSPQSKALQEYNGQRLHWSFLLASYAKVVDLDLPGYVPEHLAAALFGVSTVRFHQWCAPNPPRPPPSGTLERFAYTAVAPLIPAHHVVVWAPANVEHLNSSLRIESCVRKVVSHITIYPDHSIAFSPLAARNTWPRCSAETVYIFSQSSDVVHGAAMDKVDAMHHPHPHDLWYPLLNDIAGQVQKGGRCRVVNIELVPEHIPETCKTFVMYRWLMESLCSSSDHTDCKKDRDRVTWVGHIESVSLAQYLATLVPEEHDLEMRRHYVV